MRLHLTLLELDEWREDMKGKVLLDEHSCNLPLGVADPMYDFLQSTSPFSEDLSPAVPLAWLPMLSSVSLTTSLWCHFMRCPPGRIYLKVTQWGFLPMGLYLWPMKTLMQHLPCQFLDTWAVTNTALFISLCTVVWQARFTPFLNFQEKGLYQSPVLQIQRTHVILPKCSLDAPFI